MAETRLGRQTPTVSSVLPYTESKGQEAVRLYNASGRTAQQWQELLLEDIMAVNEEGLWLHIKFGWSVPRRNGKSEILIIRAIYGLVHGERVLYTAHRTPTSHNAWEKIIERLVKAGYVEGEDFKTMKRYGLETIEWLNGDGVIHFRTRSSKGGLGEGFDLLILDEAQEYTGDQESALKYVVTDSKNPQTLMCGTPPTAVSSGTVFLTFRRETLTGKSESAGWAEWSVPRLTDAHDPELWYETNPSLGTILTERAIRSELGGDQTDDNIQRLGLWLTYSQKSAISEREWMQFKTDAPPKLKDSVKLFFGVKFAKTSGNVSLSVAVRTADKKIFVEALDCRPVRDGLDWIVSFLRNPHTEKVVIDGAAGAPLLVQAMKNAEVKCRTILPKVSDVIEANSLFEQNLFAGEVCHAAQPSLVQAATNCEHRAIGAGGGFGYTSILENADVSLLESVTLAHWVCANTKEKKKQIITY
ncbi:MAG: terminase [Oscillospiraceae bacterium]|nr:terminase [Oscillospiraceae bacterium]